MTRYRLRQRGRIVEPEDQGQFLRFSEFHQAKRCALHQVRRENPPGRLPSAQVWVSTVYNEPPGGMPECLRGEEDAGE